MILPFDRRSKLDPDFVGVDSPLAEQVPDPEGPDDDLDEVLAARLERGVLGTQRRHERAIDRTAFAEAEYIDPDLLVGQEPRMPLRSLRIRLDGGQSCIGPDEEVVVDLPAALAVEVPGPEVGRGLELHVALGAGRLGDFRIVEAPGPVARDPREQERIVMVLAADEVAIVVQPVR